MHCTSSLQYVSKGCSICSLLAALTSTNLTPATLTDAEPEILGQCIDTQEGITLEAFFPSCLVHKTLETT